MTTVQTVRQFNQIAISRKLTGTAMQLWYIVYDRISQTGQDLYIPAAQLTEALHTGSRQLLRARTALVEAGCLAVRKQGRHTCYSIPLLHTDGDNAGTAKADTPARRPHSPKAPDIIMNHAYRTLLPDAAAQLGIEDPAAQSRLIRKLEDWCRMRRTYGWTLTAQGLSVSIANLRTHSGGDSALMELIVERTLRRKWKGFYPYIADAAPSGAALIQQEPHTGRGRRTQPFGAKAQQSAAMLPRYDTQRLTEDDFAFLELH